MANTNPEIKTINSLELASELAHQKLVAEWSESLKIYVDEEAAITTYTDEAQDVFNGLYDDYLTLIESCTIQPVVKSSAATKVLQLMDNDCSYEKALSITLKEDESINKEQLEKELNNYI